MVSLDKLQHTVGRLDDADRASRIRCLTSLCKWGLLRAGTLATVGAGASKKGELRDLIAADLHRARGG